MRLFSRQIDDLKMNSETQEVINLLGSLKDLTVKLIEQQTNQRSSCKCLV